MIKVIYAQKINETKDKVLMEDNDALFVPRKGDLINFDGLMTDLNDWEKDKPQLVHEVEFTPPNKVIVRVFRQ